MLRAVLSLRARASRRGLPAAGGRAAAGGGTRAGARRHVLRARRRAAVACGRGQVGLRGVPARGAQGMRLRRALVARNQPPLLVLVRPGEPLRPRLCRVRGEAAGEQPHDEHRRVPRLRAGGSEPRPPLPLPAAVGPAGACRRLGPARSPPALRRLGRGDEARHRERDRPAGRSGACRGGRLRPVAALPALCRRRLCRRRAVDTPLRPVRQFVRADLGLEAVPRLRPAADEVPLPVPDPPPARHTRPGRPRGSRPGRLPAPLRGGLQRGAAWPRPGPLPPRLLVARGCDRAPRQPHRLGQLLVRRRLPPPHADPPAGAVDAVRARAPARVPRLGLPLRPRAPRPRLLLRAPRRGRGGPRRGGRALRRRRCGEGGRGGERGAARAAACWSRAAGVAGLV
mmetsp:Transcript_47323/g.153789  ORF Transcript_47323/g.153789 Transcript_47323/m.153789 type:complete len:398 (+) Transcript_47323:402-1595(+)